VSSPVPIAGGEILAAPDKINKRLKPYVELIQNVRFLLALAVILIVAAVLVFTGQGATMVKHLYCGTVKVLGGRCEQWTAIEDVWHDAYQVAITELQEENMAPQPAEFQVDKISETERLYRWTRDHQWRLYRLTKGEDGLWTVNRLE
jgi:hypothetical protein